MPITHRPRRANRLNQCPALKGIKTFTTPSKSKLPNRLNQCPALKGIKTFEVLEYLEQNSV